MMNEKRDKLIYETSANSGYMDWDDVRNLARRVIRSASLAVMLHGELDVFTGCQGEDKGNNEKLTG